MKAVRYYGARDVRFEECQSPSVGPGQVLVRPTLCGICGTDLREFVDGPHWTPVQKNEFSGAELPQILGHEFAGVVEEVGPDVRSLRAGDRVSCQPIIGEHHDYYGQRAMSLFSPRSAVVGLTWPWGGMAELVLVNEHNAVRMPEELTDEQGALIEPTAVAVQAIDRSGMKSGDVVLVTGGGPIGALAAFMAQAAGAGHVVLSQRSEARRSKLREIQAAQQILDSQDPSFVEQVRASSPDGFGADVAIECSGSPLALQQCIDAVRPMGTVVIAAVVHGGVRTDPKQWFAKGINIHIANGYPSHIWPRAMKLVQTGRLPVTRLVSKTIDAKDVVEEGFLPLQNGKGGLMKVLVRP